MLQICKKAAEENAELMHMRSMCVGIAETGKIDTYEKI